MRRRVLLVDDDPVLLEVLATVLDLEDFEVVCAGGGEEALAALEPDAEPLPDVVICDVAMPDVDGLTVCRRAKADERTRHIPVILLTARGTQRDRDAGAAAGCDAYLTKPFSPLELIRVARTITTDGADARTGS